MNERTIQRDIDDIRSYLEGKTENDGVINEVVYDRIYKGFRLEQSYKTQLNNSEVLAVCKILLDSRAFTKAEMMTILKKIVMYCVPEINKKTVTDLIKNEMYHYIEPRHKTEFMDTMW